MIEGLRVKLLTENALLPEKAHPGDAGFDLFAPEQVVIPPFSRIRVGLQLAVEFDPCYVGVIQEKSGLANLAGLFTIGNIIDSGYRGEIHVILVNTGIDELVIHRHEKVAQLLLLGCYTGTRVEEVDDLTPTERGTGGFGSTGKFKRGA